MHSNLIQEAFKNNQFVLYYQPKINLHIKKVDSIEALVRIKKSDELITPSQFMHLANDKEIIDIQKWIFKKIVEDSRYISMMTNDDISISFTISNSYFTQVDFLENLTNIFSFTTDFLSQFELELVESALTKDIKDTLYKMDKLKKMGFKLSIDSFGTGYSSFLYLKDFPIDTIQIDKAFIDGISKEEKTQKILESIIFLAKKLDLKILAKDVESANQVEWLYKIGCDEIQGSYYSKVLEIHKVVRFIKAINQRELKEKYIVWSKKYSIGYYAFDTHHMIIANILNKLYEELKNDDLQNNNEVNIYFELLEMYIDIHFKAEEAYMKDILYPDIKMHHKKHKEFIDIFDDFKKNLSNSNTKNSYDLFKILKEWFVKHELKIDKLFMKHLDNTL